MSTSLIGRMATALRWTSGLLVLIPALLLVARGSEVRRLSREELQEIRGGQTTQKKCQKISACNGTNTSCSQLPAGANEGDPCGGAKVGISYYGPEQCVDSGTGADCDNIQQKKLRCNTTFGCVTKKQLDGSLKCEMDGTIVDNCSTNTFPYSTKCTGSPCQ